MVSGVGFARLAILRVNRIFPEPSEPGSAIDSLTTSCSGRPPVASPMASVRIVLPGATQASSVVVPPGQLGWISEQACPSPAALTAVTL